jgi:hypothetical protein
MSSLDNLRKSARRWLKALRAHDPAARERLARAVPHASGEPVLRDVQHALAREHGHRDWATLRRALESRRTATGDIGLFESLTEDFLLAYRTGDASALKRLGDHFGQPVTWEALRHEVHGGLARMPPGLRPAGDLTLDDVRRFAALSLGCETWSELVETLKGGPSPTHRARIEVPPLRREPRTGMLHPVELRVTLPMELPDGVYGTTTQVWQMLVASRAGDEAAIRDLAGVTPQLVRCEYNYMPPLHLAVREGHEPVVRWLLEHGASDPEYRTYPYKETLLTMAEDRGFGAIAALLREHAARPSAARASQSKKHGVGHIDFPPDADRVRLEKLLGANAVRSVESLLDGRPDLVHDDFVFWAEGILMMVANRRQRPLLELLLARGARVPDIAKWGRFYYFKHADIGALLLERGMNPNHMTWHRTTLLHDMAGEGDMEKAGLLLDHGADVNALDEEFRSAPLGFAARWGRREMVRLLLERGADPNAAAASWATPLAWAEKKGHHAIAADLRAAGAR